MKLPENIKEVLIALDEIIDESVRENNRLGIFAYVYRRTTAGIEEAIREGRFEDNARMERMDVAFANLYIRAYRDFREGLPVSGPWKVSFESGRKRISAIQHLMLGMNAHINLDLGQAAAAVAPGDQIAGLKHDFMEVNNVLAELTDIMQQKTGRTSPVMFLLDWIGQRSDEKLINFSMVKARGFSWKLAGDLAPLAGQAREERIAKAGKRVTKLARILARPPGILLNLALQAMAMTETKDVGKIIEKLRKD